MDCADRHDLRVLAQVKVDRTLPGKQDIANGDVYARVACERALADAPEAWRRGGAYADGYRLVGSSRVGSSFGMGGGGAETTVTGDYTCYLRTA